VKYSKSQLIRLYKKETNLRVKERLLIVMKVENDDLIPAFAAADELHRSRPWALYWLKRYRREEGLEGLKNRSKTVDHPQRHTKRNNIRDKKRIIIQQTWMDYNQTGRRSNCKEEWWWNKIPLYTYIQTCAQVGIQAEDTKKSTFIYSI
jgi:hypothetical protein